MQFLLLTDNMTYNTTYIRRILNNEYIFGNMYIRIYDVYTFLNVY